MQSRFQTLFGVISAELFKTKYLPYILLVGKSRGFGKEIECNFASYYVLLLRQFCKFSEDYHRLDKSFTIHRLKITSKVLIKQ